MATPVKSRIKRILIADDVAFVRKTLTQIISSAKHQVVAEAKDGIEALDLFKQHQPDLILMDIVMPRMGGIETTRQILKFFKDAKIIIVTSMGQEHLIMEAINSGARDYIVKPFRPEDILRAIDHALTSEEKISERTSKTDQSGG